MSWWSLKKHRALIETYEIITLTHAYLLASLVHVTKSGLTSSLWHINIFFSLTHLRRTASLSLS
jgi:hypothetical protein